MSDISPMWPTGCMVPSAAWVSTACIGDLMMPGDTAFTRMPRLAYSIARDCVAALRPHLVSDASTDGTVELAEPTRLVVICTKCPQPYVSSSALADCLIR